MYIIHLYNTNVCDFNEVTTKQFLSRRAKTKEHYKQRRKTNKKETTATTIVQ